MVFLFLIEYDPVFLSLFIAIQAAAVLVAGGVSMRTYRTLDSFLAVFEGKLSTTLKRIALFLRTMSCIAICIVLFFIVVLAYGDQRSANCGDVVSRQP
jgi:hypothetical protein